MRKGGGKAKGRSFEIDVAKAIGKWWCNDGDAFWRNVSSGGRVHKVASPYSGDISPVKDVAKPWRLHIECKKQEAWSFEGIAKQNASEALWSFIAQLEYDCWLSNRIGLGIFSRNRDDWYVFLLDNQWLTAPDRAQFIVNHNIVGVLASNEQRKKLSQKYGKQLYLSGLFVSWKAFTKFYSREKLKKWLKEMSKRLKQN